MCVMRGVYVADMMGCVVCVVYVCNGWGTCDVCEMGGVCCV